MNSADFTESRENKKKSSSKILPPLGSEPRSSDFTALHAIIWANSLFAGSLSFLDPYRDMLY